VKKTGVFVPGYKINAAGKLVKSEKKLDVCTRLKRQKSKKMKWKPAR